LSWTILIINSLVPLILTSFLNGSPNQIRIDGDRALELRLGPAGMIRFFQQFERGRGDYTKERHKWLIKATSVETLAEEIVKQRSHK
jgi:hypothetical protein